MHLLNYWLRASQSASLESSGARMHEGNNYKEKYRQVVKRMGSFLMKNSMDRSHCLKRSHPLLSTPALKKQVIFLRVI